MTQLPSEAGDFDSGPFEPNDHWLASASKELQIAAMRRWFLDRYEDPANETPWDGDDKGLRTQIARVFGFDHAVRLLSSPAFSSART